MILSCGEALIDMLPRTTTSDEAAFVPCAGGAVFNTAVALGRLGAPSAFLSGLSTDLFGRMLTGALDASHVDTALAIRSDRPTTLAFVTLTNGQASYAFYDEMTAGRMITQSDLPPLPATVEALFFGGISLVVEPCGATYETLMTRAAKSGRVTMIDPNIRPSFIKDEDTYRARIHRLLAMADIVKLSDEDLFWLAGRHSLASGAQTVLDRGPKLVFITEGAAGAHAFTPGRSVFVAARQVKVVDTVGAGDTFNAGALAALHRAGALQKPALADLSEEVLGKALTLATRAAAITVSRAGANPPWAEEVA